MSNMVRNNDCIVINGQVIFAQPAFANNSRLTDDDVLDVPTVNWSEPYAGQDDGRSVKQEERRDYGRTLTYNTEDDDVLGLPVVDWSRPV